jgi:uncharacterized membrane-anchored protein YitT (DUF2179 family)
VDRKLLTNQSKCIKINNEYNRLLKGGVCPNGLLLPSLGVSAKKSKRGSIMPKGNQTVKLIKKYVMLFLGSILAAVGLEIFLVPNNIIDGGIVGISIMASYVTKLQLGAFILLFNAPFFMLGYKQIGKSFAISTLFSVISLSVWVTILRPVPGLTNDLFLAAVFGGIILGIGVGIIIRYGGSLDGTEIVAIILDRRTGFSVGEIVMFFNLFILTGAGFLLGWDKAMYSLVAYFVAFKIIDITIEGLDESKAAMIISDNPEVVAEKLMARLGRGVTWLEGTGGYSREKRNVLYVVITRLEISKLKSIIEDVDENAFVTISDVHEVMGGGFKKRAIH